MARAISRRRSRGTFRGCGGHHGRYVGATRELQRRGVRGVWCVVTIGVAACAAPRVPLGDPQAEVAAMLRRSAADWNRGDLESFMGDYARDSLTSYMSGGHVQYGWQPLYDRYETAYFAPGKSHDSLSFSEARVRLLVPGVALCTARFALHRGDSLIASGPFTLILEHRSDRWVIVHDHTSADP